MNDFFHAYVIGGARAVARAHIDALLAANNIRQSANIDYAVTEHVTFTIDNARTLRQWQELTSSEGGEKVHVIYTDFITREAENALLKTLEEPVAGTHIIFAVPKPDTLLPTLLSRVRVVVPVGKIPEGIFPTKQIAAFLNMSVAERLEFVAKIAEKGDDDDASAQVREKALAFMDALEKYLSEKMIETTGKSESQKLGTLLKLKRYLFISGVSVKMLLETISLTV